VWLVKSKTIERRDREMSQETIDKIVSRYESMIEALEDKCSELKERNQELEWWANTTAWCRPRTDPKGAENNLPLPRLQMELVEDDGYCRVWFYTMVYKHLGGNVFFIPMGQVESTGGGRAKVNVADPDKFLTAMPYRMGQDIASDSDYFSMPAFAVSGDVSVLIPPEYRASRYDKKESHV